MWAFRNAAENRDARKPPASPRDDRDDVVAGRKASTAITERALRDQVWRDLERLLNAVAIESTVGDIRELPHARRSILNFGLPDIAHRSIDEISANDRAVEREIEIALKTFEPRLIDGSIRVHRDVSVDAVGLKVRFVVRAELSCRPVDIPLEFTADVELDSGRFAVSRL